MKVDLTNWFLPRHSLNSSVFQKLCKYYLVHPSGWIEPALLLILIPFWPRTFQGFYYSSVMGKKKKKTDEILVKKSNLIAGYYNMSINMLYIVIDSCYSLVNKT